MKQPASSMLIPTLVLAAIAILLIVIACARGQGQHVAGLKAAGGMMLSIVPLLVFAFIVAGMAQVLIPSQVVAKWVGKEAGLRGILVGAVAGGITPGGPYVTLPIVAGFLRAGVGVGALVAFLTGWSLWAVSRLPMEIGILGWKLTLIRLVSVFVFPPIAGVIAQVLFGGAK